LQTLADQVALAISNARLFQQAQESLEAERRAYGEISRQAWAELLHAQPGLGHRYDPHGILPTEGRWREEMKQAIRTGKTVAGEAGPSAPLAIPVKVRGHVIGVIDAHKPDDASEWTAEDAALMETLAGQLGVALESARLYQDSQRRAARERLTREITDNIRAAVSIEDAMQRAVQELGRALGAAEMVARIGTERESLAERGASGNDDSAAPGGKA
jgi:GAF domain-containing protein